MIEQRGRICPELSERVGGVETKGGGKRGEEEVSPTGQMRGNSEELGRARAGCEGP